MPGKLSTSGMLLWAVACLMSAGPGRAEAAAAGRGDDAGVIVLRAWGVPESSETDVSKQAQQAVLAAFRQRFPHIKPVSLGGLRIQEKTLDIVTLMQIAGDIAPDAIYVNFRQSDTYIRSRFLYPLDDYIERLAGVMIPDGPDLKTDQYIERLSKGSRYDAEVRDRVPRQCWEVMRRQCPYGQDCPYARARGGGIPAAVHQHVWTYPIGPVVTALSYRKDLFAEARLPDRAPATWDELLQWSRLLTNPHNDQYGLQLGIQELGYTTLNFLYSAGGLVVARERHDGGLEDWRCVFDSPEAVEAYYFVARLFHEPFRNRYGRFESVVSTSDSGGSGELKVGMSFQALDERFSDVRNRNLYGFGPVPMGPSGRRGSYFNAGMLGIYAGLEGEANRAKRDAAWEYIRFYDGPEARRIYTTYFVNNGLGAYVRPSLLRTAGFEDYVRLVPPAWEQTFQDVLDSGVPEPYGRNCQQAYKYLSDAINQVRLDDQVIAAIRAGDATAAKRRIHRILQAGVEFANRRMLNIHTPEERRERNAVAWMVVALIAVSFVLVFRRIGRAFAPPEPGGGPGQGLAKYRLAYLLMLPALATLAIWVYYPLARGTVMAFQDYNVRGFSRFIGMENFADALFDVAFWNSLWVSTKYTLLFMVFGFAAPIALAVLLTEVPRGKLLFRVIFFLPAVLSGVVVIFLWKGFYGPYGLINQIINSCIGLINRLTGLQMSELHATWTDSPSMALFFCLLPVIWAGIGPGCLIYLAALKTIPEELYEAADIDGAGIRAKIFSITLPSIKTLISINFIGAMVGAMRSGADFVLAMTGGGPYTPRGQTEVIGLQIFYQAFVYLRFGLATAMAWILGTLLIGFTVLQLQRLGRVEFRAAGGIR